MSTTVTAEIAAPTLHLPILRLGTTYESLDLQEVPNLATGEAYAHMSMANAGLIRRDLMRIKTAGDALRQFQTSDLLGMCERAATLFMEADLPAGTDASGMQSPEDFVRALSSTGGMPHAMVRANMGKLHYVLAHMPEILRGLTRDLPTAIFDGPDVLYAGLPLSYRATTDCLGVVLPSNSPGVNSLWIPALAMKVPVVMKPGKNDPWTPWRLIQALIAAGMPREAFGYYPTDHEGANTLMRSCGRAIIFGGQATVDRYKDDPRVSVHGPGYSKVVIDDGPAENYQEVIDLAAKSIAANGGRSCINASMVVTTKNGRAIAGALAQKLAHLAPTDPDDPNGGLAAFAAPQMAEGIEAAVAEGLKTPGAEDLSAPLRHGPLMQQRNGAYYVLPAIIWCEDREHPLVGKEFMCPFATVVECPRDEMAEFVGPTLACSVYSDDEAWLNAWHNNENVDRLNTSRVPTNAIRWDQPHEGNLFEFLYRRRAIGGAPPMHPIPGTPANCEFRSGPTRVIFGAGSAKRLGELAAELGRRALLVSDPGLVEAGHVARAKDRLEEAGLTVTIFAEVHENPTTDDVGACLKFAESAGVDLIIGFGGGSSLDTAKGCNFLLTNGGAMQDYWGDGKATKPLLPLIAVPTTAGTGSECQRFALIADADSHRKMACGDPKCAATVALLDPDLTLSQPHNVAACTGLDALVHALETAVTKRRNPLSDLYSRQAFEYLLPAFRQVLRNPADTKARAAMQLGAAFAGMAIENSMLGAAHAAANPITATYGTIHGNAVSFMIPHVIRHNGSKDEATALAYRDLAAAAGLCGPATPPSAAVRMLADTMAELREESGLAAPPIAAVDILALAAAATKEWTGTFNPAAMTAKDFEALYRAALG